MKIRDCSISRKRNWIFKFSTIGNRLELNDTQIQRKCRTYAYELSQSELMPEGTELVAR